ncbi:metalloregulator ArsR/SmtB family transcription factor [Niveibacterium sp. SC-1]|uniref:ArsR/SmtB family transcription factor n=1 Tax=Niveibacterium sp. SC-1 TaxID=3135646 RepID=UPI0031202C31
MPTTDVFGAIANPVRRRILELLLEGPRPAGEIAAAFTLNRPAISEHLQVLRLTGLVSEEAQGRQRVYRLNPGSLSEVETWLHPFERYWLDRLDALDKVLSEK